MKTYRVYINATEYITVVAEDFNLTNDDILEFYNREYPHGREYNNYKSILIASFNWDNICGFKEVGTSGSEERD